MTTSIAAGYVNGVDLDIDADFTAELATGRVKAVRR